MRELRTERFAVHVTKVLPPQINTKQRPIAPIPLKKSKELLQQRVIDGLRRLEAQAERINQLSAELEIAMIELKSISTDVNQDLRARETANKLATSVRVCEYSSSIVPYVGQKPCGSLILTTRPVDLFQSEREAALIAQGLRERMRRKQHSKSSIYRKH